MVAGDKRIVVHFRQPPSTKRVLPCVVAFMPLLLAAAGAPVLVTQGTDREDAGLGIAITLTLLVALCLALTVYRLMTPMTTEAGDAGLTLTNGRTGAQRTLRWGELRHSLIADPSGDTLLLHHDGATFNIPEHPAYAKSPPRFAQLREIVLRKTQPLE